jgi:pyruvate formate-lyase activating enzyme-like uncharacterized protein
MEHLEDVDAYRPVHTCSLLRDAQQLRASLSRIVRRLMNELERIGKETAVAYFRVTFQLRKVMKIRDMKRVRFRYKLEELPPESSCSDVNGRIVPKRIGCVGVD